MRTFTLFLSQLRSLFFMFGRSGQLVGLAPDARHGLVLPDNAVSSPENQYQAQGSPRPSLLRLGLVLILITLPAGVARAQSGITLQADFYGAHLTGREHTGQYTGLSARKNLTPLFYVIAKAGYLRSVNRSLDIIPWRWDSWRDRHHYNVDLGIGLNALRLTTGPIHHRLGPSLSLSFRYRREELGGRFYSPAFFNSLTQEELDQVYRGVEEDPNAYLVYYDDGAGIGIDGQYLLLTSNARAHDVGLVGGLNYHAVYRHIVLGVEAGLYRYLHQGRKWGGTHTYYYGISAGYRF